MLSRKAATYVCRCQYTVSRPVGYQSDNDDSDHACVPGVMYRQWYQNYNHGAAKAAMDQAVDMVHSGQLLTDVVRIVGIPKTTIWRRLQACRLHTGPCRGAKMRQDAHWTGL